MEMFWDSLWGAVPLGFKKVADGRGGLMVVREDMAAHLTIEECTKPSAIAATPVALEGRGKLRSVSLGGGDTALIRPYRHGGLLRHLTRRVYVTWPPRPFRELAITEEVRRRGIPTVEVYAACVKRIWGPFYHGWLVTRKLPEGEDLWTAIQGDFAREAGTEKLLKAVATSLRGLHREGVYHPDLNLKNILVRRESNEVRGYIIDLDRATLFLGEVPRTMVQRNLDRFLRSACKLDPKREFFSEQDWKTFVNSYRDHNAKGP
jgi:tRNA A-37 threonylcarbamoyl transferase component Bud32